MRIRWLEKLGKPGTSFPGCGPGASKRHLDLGAKYHLTFVIKKIFYLKNKLDLSSRKEEKHNTPNTNNNRCPAPFVQHP